MARNNQKAVPEAMDSLDRFKYEVASDHGVKKIFIKVIPEKVLELVDLKDYYIIL